MFYCAKFVALFGLGFVAGLIISLMVSGIVDAFISTETAEALWFTIVMWVAAILLGIICGVIVIKIQRILFILLTAVIGSFLAVGALDYIFGDGAFISVIVNAFSGSQNDFDASWVPIVLLTSWIILALLGITIQFCLTAKNFSHKKKHKPKPTSNQNGATPQQSSGNGQNYQIIVNN